MTTELKPETKEVDLHGVKVALPVDVADKMIAARDADKAKGRELLEKLGKLDADAAAAIAKANKSEEDRVAAEHMKKGEIDQARNTLTKEFRDREAKLSAKARDKHIAAIVASNDNVVKSAVDDIVDSLKSRTRYDLDSESVIVLDEAGQPLKDANGKPIEADAFFGSWLEKRPHYLLNKLPKGAGGEGSKTNLGKVITAAQYGDMKPSEQAVFFRDGGKIA